MKIIGIGWNYPKHNDEMGRKFVPKEPTIFLMPDSALLKGNKPFFVPDFSEDVQYETEIVLIINKLGKCIDEKFAHRYYDQIALGVDFTARDLQNEAKEKGKPWAISKGFDGSAVLSESINLSDLPNENAINFTMEKNGEIVQVGNTKDMLFTFDQLVAYVSRFYTLKTGDLIYTGTPSGVGRVVPGDRLVGKVEGNVMFDFNCK